MELTPFEQTLHNDTTQVVEEPYGPGLPVVLVAEDGTEHESAVVDGVTRPMCALFDATGLDVSGGIGASSQAAVVSSAPMLHIQLSLVQSALGRPLTTRDAFRVRGTLYRVQRPHPDGFGFIACKLLEKD